MFNPGKVAWRPLGGYAEERPKKRWPNLSAESEYPVGCLSLLTKWRRAGVEFSFSYPLRYPRVILAV